MSRGGTPAATLGGFDTIHDARVALPDARLLDVRDEQSFALGHAPEAGRLSLAEFEPRRPELPSRETAVLVMHDEPAAAREAAEHLAARGYARVAWLARPLVAEPSGHASRAAAARLWSPSEFIEREAGRALAARPDQEPGRALDLACGSGRAAVFLALSGWRAEGWDADGSALALARAFATRQGVNVPFVEHDLESATPPAPAEAYDLIVVVRYLHRPLFAWIERALAPGGVLLYETFRDGQQRFGSPRRERHLLRAGELLTAFPLLAVERHEETPDGAPPLLARLVARRPG